MTKEKETEKLPEPGFIEQANALIDESYGVQIEDPKFGHGLLPRDHKLLVRIMDLQVSHVYDVLVEEFGKKVAEHYGPIMNELEKLAEGQQRIDANLSRIEARMDEFEKKQMEFDMELEKLKIIHKVPATFDERLKEVEKLIPAIEESKKYMSPKWTGIRWGTAIIIATLLGIVIHESVPDFFHKIFQWLRK